MRFPDIDFMKRTFDLVRNRLKISNKLIPVIMGNPNTFYHFNGIRAKRSDYLNKDKATDTFKVGITSTNKDWDIPQEYIEKGHKKLYDEALSPLKDLFVTNSFPDAFKELVNYDSYSVKSYMSVVMKYPQSVIRWIETMEWRTGMFDAGLTDTVLADLAFADPRKPNAEWFCFE